MSRIARWKCRLPSQPSGKRYPMVCVDEQTEAEYALHGDRAELKTLIFHDGTSTGRNQAESIASSLQELGVAVRSLGAPGIIAIYPAACHTVPERKTLMGVGK